MSTQPVIPANDYVDVVINIGPQLPATPTFNIGAIVDTSSLVPSSQRTQKFSSAAALLTAGAQLTDAIYIAAGIYFGQIPSPQSLVVIRQDLTAIAAVAVDAGGEGYVAGDIVTVVQAGASGGKLKVTTVDAGVVTGLAIINNQQGTSYTVSAGDATTGGTGIGLTVNITSIGETPLQAVTAGRSVDNSWYEVVAPNAADADHLAISQWAASALPQSMYKFASGTANIATGATGNLFSQLKTLAISRSFGIYSTTQNGLYPNNIYAGVAAMGRAMGLNTGLANSFFNMMYKNLVGIAPEPIDDNTKAIIEGNFGNVYVGVANAYQWLETGTVFSGQWYDEVLNFDMLASDYQYSTIDLLISQASIPQDNAGQTQLLGTIDQCNSRAATRGFLAGGTWLGVQILNLNTGDPLPLGYRSQSPAASTQSPSDKAARKALPIYVAILEAGAIQSVLIGVYPQR
jgi:hypothetical protein